MDVQMVLIGLDQVIQLSSYSPVDGSKLGNVSTGNKDDYDKLIDNAQKAFISFRKIPAPKTRRTC